LNKESEQGLGTERCGLFSRLLIRALRLGGNLVAAWSVATASQRWRALGRRGGLEGGDWQAGCHPAALL